MKLPHAPDEDGARPLGVILGLLARLFRRGAARRLGRRIAWVVAIRVSLRHTRRGRPDPTAFPAARRAAGSFSTAAHALRRTEHRGLTPGTAPALKAFATERRRETMTKPNPMPVALILAAFACQARALVPGGGPARTDCYAGFQVTTEDRAATRAGSVVDCQDGDPSCDVDGEVNGACAIGVSICTQLAGVAGCTPGTVDTITLGAKTTSLGVAAPTLPATDARCGEASVLSLPLRHGARGFLPSRPVVLRMTATADDGTKDRDHLRLRCVPNVGAAQCPTNPAGGASSLVLSVASEGTDLDNGVSGLSHNFPIPEGAELHLCLAGCDAESNPTCHVDEAATDQVKSRTFGPPLPLFSAGVPVCIVNRFATPSFTSGTADVTSGAVAGDLHLLSDVYLTTSTQVCPHCSATAGGGTGVCVGGRRDGQACRTEAVLDVALAPGDGRYALSSDCTPTGTPAGTLDLTLPVTTGTATLAGPRPCGATADDGCHGGTCDAACTGSACVARTATGDCIDVKGGISQVCCATNTQLACFPTGSGTGAIVRTGAAAAPLPAWPDAGFPKTSSATLVSTFCESATGSILVDAVTGLPGPGALVLPVAERWVP
jgi:hypothetical protein